MACLDRQEKFVTGRRKSIRWVEDLDFDCLVSYCEMSTNVLVTESVE